MPKIFATTSFLGSSTPARSPPAVSFAPRPHTPYAKPCSSKDAQTWKDIVVLEFLKRPSFLKYLSSPGSDLYSLLDEIFDSRPDLRPPCHPSSYVYCVVDALRTCSELGGTSLSQALSARLSIERAIRLEARSVRHNFNLYKQPEARVCTFVCAQLFVKALPAGELYPPPGFFIASTRRMARKWEQDLRSARAADKRNPHRGVHILEPDRLQLTIPSDLSCVVHDADTRELVLVVVRNFCSNGAILSGIALAGSRALGCRRSVRLSDTGALAQLGFSAGLRSAPAFGLARNFASRAKGSGDAERESNEELAAALSYFWVRAKAKFPAEVIADIEDFFGAHCVPRFDPHWPHSSTSTTSLNLAIGGVEFTVPDVERAPACAVVAQGYARPVHREHQDHLWGIGWNYCRQGSSLIGGHFYLSSHGIQMLASHDTAWSWMPTLFHTTGLSNAHPSTLGSRHFRLEGLAFVTPIRLAAAYARWAQDSETPRGLLLATAYNALDTLLRDSEDGARYCPHS